MAPIDPHQLLKALSPLLSSNGAIKSPTEVGRVASLMKDANKLVSKCVYINILRATQAEDTLEKFISLGGWDTLNNWLQDSKTSDNMPFLVELLKVYQQLPVTVEILKQNKAAKTIKSLAKSEDSNLKTLSNGIVENWMEKIKKSNSSEKASKKKEERKDKKSDHKDKHDKHKHKEKSSHHHHHHHHHHQHNNSTEEKMDTSEQSLSSDRTSENSDQKTDSTDHNFKSEDISDKELKKRPKTVKTFASKFRSTGLEEAASLPGKKKPPVPTSDNVPKPVLPKRQSTQVEMPPEKKSRLSLTNPLTVVQQPVSSESLPINLNTSPTEELHGRIKLIPAKPKPIHAIHESTGFMDEITKTTRTTGTIRRRKRSNSTSNKSPTSPTKTSPVTSPTTTKLTTAPSFYRDTMEEEPSIREERTPSPTESIEIKDLEEDGMLVKDDDSKVEENDNIECIEQKRDVSQESVTSEEGSVEIKSLLTTGATTKRKVKKTVQWAEESKIREIFYFEMDETERENVNRIKDFNCMKRNEMRMDRRVFESAKRMISDTMCESIPWRKPELIDGVVELVIPGCNSKEKEIQRQRESVVLQALFFNRLSLPDTPNEPENEAEEPKQPKIIPLEDEHSGVDDVVHVQQPPPVATQTHDPNILPPELQSLVASVQQGGPIPHIDATNPVMANMQNILSSLLGGNPDNGLDRETTEKLKSILEPIKGTIPGFAGHGMHQENMPPNMHGPPRMGGPPMNGRGNVMGPNPQFGPPQMMGPRGPGGPGGPPGPGGMNGPPGGPGGHGGFGGPNNGPMFRPNGPPGPHDGNNWGDNMGGGAHGAPRGPGPDGFHRGHGPPRGRGGPPRGRGGPSDMRGGPRSRGGGRQGGPVCRHFIAGGCRRGSSCGFMHPRGHS